ncbi:TetR family transcriptional regulator [Rhodoferax sp.]|uniref:TetR family transcriptional regulator n=1 Tax=Rhodoferax sp. TaxID=50421 RepID=UPI00276F2F71|nr:TetR family transcriptional regulator [Rhodoferax sp.]
MPTSAQTAISKQRARSQADKDLRRTHLIAAARHLFAKASFEAVTIAEVAEQAGVAKGTAYIYFANKETLFLELVRAELSDWLVELTLKLKRLRSTDLATAVPRLLARSVTERAALRRLLVLLHSVIEPHIDEVAARDFKLFLHDLLTQGSTAIAAKLPGLSPQDAATLVLQLHALVISVTQLADPPPVIAKVMSDDPKLQAMCIDFESFMTATLTTLVRGTLHKG